MLYLLGGIDRGALKGAVIRLTLGKATRSDLAAWSREFTTRLLRTALYAEALACITEHQRSRAHLVLLSASPDLYVPEIARALGFDECICTELRWHEDGTLDGVLASVNCRGPEKTRCVSSLLVSRQPGRSHAYGNSTADLDHLRLVSAGTYVNGNPRHLADSPNVRAVRWREPGSTTPVAGAARV